MRFVTLCRVRGGTFHERVQRRLSWNFPEGIEVVAEYWLPSTDPNVILVTETDRPETIMTARADWDDVFEMETYPAMTAEEGLELGRKMVAAGKKEKKGREKEPVTL